MVSQTLRFWMSFFPVRGHRANVGLLSAVACEAF